ncbi:NAD-P-binding protein [Sistotremastrum niveocremeum HHB9708]|uniref:NAD-P-binding protein n=1 Tax=Sistotremastrum niveocremeum HHB9708 TaxID=1314777 RepID=A0A164NEK5_9AGAM|nr:NAD-P-binding protein [Sistotremastrum niveocremeum HHB9708]
MGAFVSTPKSELVDLKGKVAIVTGGHAGIGYATVQLLVRQGAKVYIAARNESKVTGAIALLESEGLGPGNGTLQYLNLDLSDPRNGKKSAEIFSAKEERLDILVNNAGVSAMPLKLTNDGLAEVMVTNYLTHYVFTEHLLPLLKNTASQPNSDVRIVNVSSQAHSLVKGTKSQPLSFDSVENFNGQFSESWLGITKRNSWSKLAQILHIKYLQNTLTASSIPITCLAIHPGGIRSPSVIEGSQYQPWYIKIGFKIISTLFYKPVEHGGAMVAFAAASVDVADERKMYRGAYVVPDRKISPGSEAARDTRLIVELRQTTENILSEMGL